MLFYLLLEVAYYDQNLKEGRALGKRKTSLNLKLRLLARYLSLDFLLDHLLLHVASNRKVQKGFIYLGPPDEYFHYGWFYTLKSQLYLILLSFSSQSNGFRISEV